MDLIAITFDSVETAQTARREFGAMGREHVVELADSVVAYKDEKGNVQLDQTINLTGAGAASGGVWGMLIGLILSIPTGGLVLPVVSAGIGVGVGALSGKLSDYGIDDDMMKQLSGDIEAGKATLFVLARKVTPDKVIQRLAKYQGKVLQTSLSDDFETDLRIALTPNKAA